MPDFKFYRTAIKYYHWPVAGIGQNTYTCDVSYGGGLSLTTTLSANFWLSTYDWSSMMDDYDYRPMDDNRIYCLNGDDEYVLATQAQQDAVAKLMSDVGIAMEMDYGSDYSAGKGDYAAKALERYFQYRDSWKYISRNTYKGDWDATLRKELDELRPILYCGSSSTSSHALVFDGYRSDGYFHINWGWGGRYNGYFMSSLLNPIGDGRYTYNGDQYAYIGIQPDHEAKPAVYPITPGDVNADKMIDIDDVNLVINQMVKKVSLSERQMVNADCHRDGVVDIDDMNEIINMMVGKSEYYQTQFETFTVNGVSFKMAKVSGGTFLMGATADQIGVSSCFDDDERPIHPVTLSGYSIGVTEVTQALWQAVMGNNPSFFSSSNGYADNLQRPVEHVDWYDCQTFITKLNTLTGMRFRLPSEAEWEFAARGGNMSKGYKYAGSDNINDVAWYWNSIPSQSIGTSGYGTQTVATKMPNELGLYDMSGNVWEWCQDWFNKYSGDAQKNPTGPESGSNRVFRGGGWDMNAKSCRVSERDYWRATINTSNLGLRLAR